MVKFHF